MVPGRTAPGPCRGFLRQPSSSSSPCVPAGSVQTPADASAEALLLQDCPCPVSRHRQHRLCRALAMPSPVPFLCFLCFGAPALGASRC